MAYVAVVKALYDYTAQDPETELSLKEDQIAYVVEKEDDDWWKAKLKHEAGEEGAIGLIPATYVEELPPLNTTRAMYAYDSTSPEELSMGEDDVLHVFSVEEDWLLVRAESGNVSTLGFVPRSYCEQLDESAAVEVTDADDAEADIEAHRREEEQEEKQRQVAEKQRLLKLKDKVETWSISEMEGKKKKKGTLGVGNGAVFFASDTDKMSGVKQYNISELSLVSQPSSKNLELTFTSLSVPLLFHCGSSDTAGAILAKLESSKAAAGEALEMAAATGAMSGGEEQEEYDTHEEALPATTAVDSKTVRWANDASEAPAPSQAEAATVLYDFDAQGDDELTVRENEVVTVVDKENDEWWSVRNASGQEGVVPAQYVQIDDGTTPATAVAAEEDDGEEEARHQEEEAAAAAALEAERQREAAKKAEERRAIERAARERQKLEEEDRAYAEEVERKEAAKAERRARRQQEELRSQQDLAAARRREEARGLEPPKISKRPSAQDVSEVARSLPIRGKQAPARPPENNRPKPTTGRTRVWNDKTGQFKVEAEYLGLNGNKIRLHKLNGVIIEVPLEKMATEDVQLIRRHEARKARAAMDDPGDVPFARRGQSSRSNESRARVAGDGFQPVPPEAMEVPKPRKPRFDWFAFFLDCGCGIDDCTRYAANFERDRIDEEIVSELDASTLRSLGLKEGDVIRVRKAITSKFAKKTPEQEAQIHQDEEYAKQLQEHEISGSKGPIPQPPPSLFTSSNGKLANNTRRGRPEKKSIGAESVDMDAIAAASDQLSITKVSTPPPPAIASAPHEKPQSIISGFDDDAWTIKPSASKPASPAPVAPTAPPAPAPPPAPATTLPVTTLPVSNTTESLLAQIQAMRPSSTTPAVVTSNTGSSGNFDQFARVGSAPPVQQRQQQPPHPQMNSYGLGALNSNQTMGQMANAPRGPLAPVPTNEGLLNPLQPAQTGFVPTRAGVEGMGGGGGQNGMMAQPTGLMGQAPMQMQPTGYAQGFQQAYGGLPQQIQSNMTGYPGNFGQQSQQSSFNAVANIGPPQQSQNPDKFAPSNIFAAMKKTEFGKPEEQQPQQSNKYDALRPLTTGYNGSPGMMPQQTGMMGNDGYTPGMMAQMTGFNPQQMGYIGQQNYQQGYR